MPNSTGLGGCLGEIDVEFVEREATPRLLLKLGIQLHLAGLSLSNTVSILEIFGVTRARSTIHNWVHKASYSPAYLNTIPATGDTTSVFEAVIMELVDWLYSCDA